ncbi:MAG: DUF4338 domain-containing protein, partial [Desulfobacteraceae bacterium]|nr:DUF4338 domain-containing protein [Desulfobacteraceae bacterium]
MARYCGREFSEKEIEIICKMIKEDSNRSRYKISLLVCEDLGWRKPDGGLKDMSCRVALLRMEKDGLIRLPPPKCGHSNSKVSIQRTSLAEPGFPIDMPVHLMSDLRLELVETKKASSLWNEYIDRYHYLGYTKLPGAQLTYFARFEGQDIALLGFGASAWKVEARDHFIGWTPSKHCTIGHLIVNNARFLILPWVKSRNLASRVLSMVSKRLPHDWVDRYNYRPVLLETFVECNRFHGTSYKASNWICVGQTKGRGKKDVHKRIQIAQE